MKGVILGIAPGARIVDLCHEVPPQDIRTAAYQLMVSVDYFPKGSIFVCVVDPGVGSRRRILWARSSRHQFLFPDNGLIGWVAVRECREVSDGRLWLPEVSSTFHGRDIFAPTAARLSRRLSPERLGPRVERFERLPFPQPTASGGEILVIDGFGNAVTNLRASEAERILYKGRDLGPLRSHYGEVDPGALVALSGSSGFIELSIRDGDFAGRFGAKPGDRVNAILRRRPAKQP